jgi:signal peptidase I
LVRRFGPRRLATRGNLATLLSLLVFVGGFLVIGPATLGGPATYVMVDGTSMEPTLRTGDLAVVRRSGSYQIGEIVAYHPTDPIYSMSGLVIHRIVGGSAEDGYLTRGDNRPNDDPWRPRPEDVAGSVWFVAPGAGAYLARLREPLVIAPLAAAMTVFFIMLGGGTSKDKPASPANLAIINRRLAALREAHAR